MKATPNSGQSKFIFAISIISNMLFKLLGWMTSKHYADTMINYTPSYSSFVVPAHRGRSTGISGLEDTES